MEILTDLKELAGKTIKSAEMVDCDTYMALLFTDDTCAFVGGNQHYDSFDIELTSDVEDYAKRDAGVMSQAEYDRARRKADKEARIRREAIERKRLAVLQAKYGDKNE